ncbi:hypothetical protein [Bradyrhizobium japonicum]|uniref:hypothetical protein n=1 Tax=Bradyrhizobium japonicum TaxID=375 RepID=UPI002714763D|nr:hypothetical protein [Bradyrhizobium japonicum]WLB53803.1 hypothetical protein QIH94_42475 [Bradyrhizobium japonicum]WLB64324.1 hypothetical protein QIH96_03310 [Bradyrhizobium japonicum]
MIHSEYGYTEQELPEGNCYVSDDRSEAAYISGLVSHVEGTTGRSIDTLSICVDITGFMRPHLVFLPFYLKTMGVKKYDVLYSEPKYYAKKEQTVFSEGTIVVRQIEGFEGVNSTDQTNDFLVVGSGYDHRLIKAVAENKDKADKVQIFGLPSLRADMYQENVMRAGRASDAIGANKSFDRESFFAPANDPFITAEVVSEIVRLRKKLGPISNLYLSPLATKPQALGFALFYLSECIDTATSILFPVSSKYARETSVGLQRVWQYTVE